METKNIVIGVLSAAVVVLGTLLVVRPVQVQFVPLGGSSSQFQTEKQYFAGGALLGGGTKTISNGGGGTTTSSLSAADVCDNIQFIWNAVNIASTTLPDGPSLQQTCLKNSGTNFSKEVFFRNTGTGTIDFVAGASSTFFYAASTTTDKPFVSGTVVRLLFVSATSTGVHAVEIYKDSFTPR